MWSVRGTHTHHHTCHTHAWHKHINTNVHVLLYLSDTDFIQPLKYSQNFQLFILHSACWYFQQFMIDYSFRSDRDVTSDYDLKPCDQLRFQITWSDRDIANTCSFLKANEPLLQMKCQFTAKCIQRKIKLKKTYNWYLPSQHVSE